MRQFLMFICLISSVLSFAQSQEKEKKVSRAIPQTNNSVNEPLQEEVQSVAASKSIRSQKRQKIDNVSSSLSLTVSQASRMSTQKNFTKDQIRELNNGVQELKRIDKNSFEYHLYNYLKSPFDFDQIESLRKAESLNAYNFAVLYSFSAYHYIQGNESDLNNYLSKLFQGKYFNDNLLQNAELSLKSLPKNTVLISHGKDDTYPLLINQKIKKIRSDVEIISLEHLLSEDYRLKLMKRGFDIPERELIDSEFLNQFILNNGGRNIVCSNTLPSAYLKALDVKLFVAGFGFSSVNQGDVNVRFYEGKFVKILPTLLTKGSNITLSNSLPLLFDVRNYYIDKKKYKKSEDVEVWLRSIGRALGKVEQINSLLK